MVLSDKVFFESSVIGSSKGSSVKDSSLGLSVLFLTNSIIFLKLKYIFVNFLWEIKFNIITSGKN